MKGLELRFSGAFDVRWAGEPWGLPDRKDTLRLWLALLLGDGHPRERAAVALLLWPDLAREQRGARLRYHLHALRRYLPSVDAAASPAGWILVEGSTLAWKPEAAVRSDLGRLRAGLPVIDAALEAGRDIEAMRQLAIALAALDHGPLLPGTDEPFLAAPREEMDRLQRDLLDRLAELHRRAGRVDAAVERSRDLLRRRPGDERAHRRLMRVAAARLDRNALEEAFAICRAQARETEDRAVEAETARLHAGLLRWLERVERGLAAERGDASASAMAPSDRTSKPAPKAEQPGRAVDVERPFVATPEALQLDPLVDELGRLESLRALHAKARCLTLTGPGGSGKTRLLLALMEAEGHPPARLLDLDRLHGVQGLYHALAARLGIPEGLVHGNSADVAELLAHGIGRREQVLLLDHGEWLVSGLAELLEQLLPRCPGLRLVQACRETLRIPGETVWRMPLMTVPRHRSGRVAHGEAMAFLERKRRNLGQRLGIDERGAMARICIALDGHAAALVAATQALRDGSPSALADRLERAPSTILDTSLPRPDLFRYADLHSSIQADLRRLGSVERRLLRALAALEPAFGLDRIREIGEGILPPESIPSRASWVEILQLLREKSLIEVEVLPDGDYAYRLLPALRAHLAGPPAAPSPR